MVSVGPRRHAAQVEYGRLLLPELHVVEPSPSSTRLVAQTAVSVLVQAAGVQTIEAILSIHTPGVPEVRMTRETPARTECDVVHISPSGITFSGIVKLQPEARDSHRVCAGAFVHSQGRPRCGAGSARSLPLTPVSPQRSRTQQRFPRLTLRLPRSRGERTPPGR
jgi:hypothetical protein